MSLETHLHTCLYISNLTIALYIQTQSSNIQYPFIVPEQL